MTVQGETERSWQCNGIRGPRRRSLAIRRATERQDRTNGQRSALGGAMGYGNRDGVPWLSEGATERQDRTNGQRSALGGAMGYGNRDGIPRPEGGYGASMTVQRETECSWQCNGIRGPRRRSLAIRRATERQDRTNGQRSALGGAMGYGNRDGVPRPEGGYGASMTVQRETECSWQCNGIRGPRRRSLATRRATERQDRTNGQRSTLGGAMEYGALVDVRRLPEGLRSGKTGSKENGAPSAPQSGTDPSSTSAGYPKGYGAAKPVQRNGALSAPRWDTETATTFSGCPKGYGAAKPDQWTTEHSRRRNRVSVPGGVGVVAASPASCIPHVRPLGRSWDVEGRKLFFHPVRKGQLSSMAPATGLPRWTSTNAPGPWLHAVHPTASPRTVK